MTIGITSFLIMTSEIQRQIESCVREIKEKIDRFIKDVVVFFGHVVGPITIKLLNMVINDCNDCRHIAALSQLTNHCLRSISKHFILSDIISKNNIRLLKTTPEIYREIEESLC